MRLSLLERVDNMLRPQVSSSAMTLKPEALLYNDLLLRDQPCSEPMTYNIAPAARTAEKEENANNT